MIQPRSPPDTLTCHQKQNSILIVLDNVAAMFEQQTLSISYSDVLIVLT